MNLDKTDLSILAFVKANGPDPVRVADIAREVEVEPEPAKLEVVEVRTAFGTKETRTVEKPCGMVPVQVRVARLLSDGMLRKGKVLERGEVIVDGPPGLVLTPKGERQLPAEKSGKGGRKAVSAVEN